MRFPFRRLAVCVLAALVATVPLSAQDPGAFSKLGVTDTSANALRVGCTIGSTGPCTGGVKAGPAVLSQVTVNSVGIVGTDGRIPAINGTYFASLSGASLTGLDASQLASGTVPTARLSGTYSSALTLSSSSNSLRGSFLSSDGTSGTTIACPTAPTAIIIKNGIVTSVTC